MARSSIAVAFAGSGGSGAMTAGAVFLRAAARAGYYGMMTELFGAQVRGGESAALVQISTELIQAQPDRYDLFVALDWDKVEQFVGEIPLDEASIIIADPKAGPIPLGVAKLKADVVPLAMSDPSASRLETALHGCRVNMFATGAASALIGLPAADVQAACPDGHQCQKRGDGRGGGDILAPQYPAQAAGSRRASSPGRTAPVATIAGIEREFLLDVQSVC